MSYSIVGKRVTLTRGDTLNVPVEVTNPDGTPYEMQDGDSLRFKMTDVAGGSVLIEKQIPTDTLILSISHSDTANLPFGTYFFDVQFTYASGSIETIIPEGQFCITAETDGIDLDVYAPGGE